MTQRNDNRGESIAIGGYYELECPDRFMGPGRYLYQSARAALGSLLLQSRVRRAWLPHFLCHTVADELHRVGIETAEFTLENDLSPSRDLAVTSDEAALVVNYFGVCSERVEQALDRLPRDRCVVDNSQGYGVRSSDCLGTIYSPRKFFGVPDGGYLETELDVVEPDEADQQSRDRCEHLLIRLDGRPEEGLKAYRWAEASLAGVAHRRMSRLTRRLMGAIDCNGALERRRKNFMAIHELFSTVNRFPFASAPSHSPLSYPLMLPDGADHLRKELQENRVFSPTYWPELMQRNVDEQSTRFARQIVHIPIDQRYEPTQLLERLRTIPAVGGMIAGGYGG